MVNPVNPRACAGGLLCVCVCVCMLCEDIEKECRVGRAFVHFTWAATQCPCSPSLEAPARPALIRTQAMLVCMFVYMYICMSARKSASEFRAGHQGSTHFHHRMATGFGPFKLPTCDHLWKWAGPLPWCGVRQP